MFVIFHNLTIKRSQYEAKKSNASCFNFALFISTMQQASASPKKPELKVEEKNGRKVISLQPHEAAGDYQNSVIFDRSSKVIIKDSVIDGQRYDGFWEGSEEDTVRIPGGATFGVNSFRRTESKTVGDELKQMRETTKHENKKQHHDSQPTREQHTHVGMGRGR